jgi:hypothetical protein
MDINPNYCDCKTKISYSVEYDAHYCAECNKWTESTCDDANCEYCVNRPDKPLEEK